MSLELANAMIALYRSGEEVTLSDRGRYLNDHPMIALYRSGEEVTLPVDRENCARLLTELQERSIA